MQDIVFYAAAHETLGIVRDSVNAKKKPAPVLALGVSVRLRMRLFAGLNVATPYPIASFNDITDWQWNMDGDFDRSTACKLVADSGGISVHTVSDTVEGKTMNFTEFVIPISNMNTEELAAWLGNQQKRSGLTGELVGYNSSGNAVFMLQIENFTVRNRVAGLCDPTALDQEIVTRTQAEHLIQAAVSASAATKQDKLSSANAGTGISISSNGTISTANIPQSSVAGLSASLAAKQDNISAGDLIELNGTTVNRRRYMSIIPENQIITRTVSIDGVTANALVLEPGNAYRISAISAQKWLATTAAFKGSSDTWGLESHIELFVAGTGFVHADSNVVLANALEPDAVNNCTVRFHDGMAIISVEDHVAGYIVTVDASSGAGSLAYGLATATNEYIAVDASLNGQTLDLAGATTYAGEKHVVGNGYAETVLSGGIVCTSKTTFSNLSMDGVINSGGTMTLGDVYIPNGATVAVSGGGRIAAEKVTGDGGTVAFKFLSIPGGASSYVGNIQYKPGANGGILVSGTLTFDSCDISNFGGGNFSLVTADGLAGTANFKNCYVHDPINHGQWGYDIGGFTSQTSAGTGTHINIEGSTFGSGVIIRPGAYCSMNGSNHIQGTLIPMSAGFGTVTLASGAILDLTGNTNTTPIAPGGGITFASGGATVLYSSGAVSGSYMMDNVTLPAGAKLTNTAVVDLNSASVQLTSATTISASGATFANGSATSKTVDGSGTDLGGVIYLYSTQAKARFEDCTFTGGNASFGGICTVKQGSAGGFTREPDAVFSNCTMSGNRATIGGCIAAMNGGYVKLTGCSATNNRVSGGGAPFFANGGYLWFDGLTGNNFTVLRGGSARLKITSNNKFESDITGDAGGGIVTIESDAVIDLTGNSNALPVNPLGGVVVGSNVHIYPSAGSASAVEISGGTYAAITNGGVLIGPPKMGDTETISGSNAIIDFNNSYKNVSSAMNIGFSGVTITGGSNTNGGAFTLWNGKLTLTSCNVTGNTATSYAASIFVNGGECVLTDCYFGDNDASVGDIVVSYGTHLTISGGTYGAIACYGGFSSSGHSEITINGYVNLYSRIYSAGATAQVTITSEAVIELTGNTNAVPIAPGDGIILYGGIDVPTRIVSGENDLYFVDLEIHGTSITNQGFIYGATVYFPETHSGYDVQYIPDGTTISSAVITGGTPAYVVSGGLVGVIQHYEDD